MAEGYITVGEYSISRLAIDRARDAMDEDYDAEFGVGFCEGVIAIHGVYYTSAWCAVVERSGVCHLSGGLHLRLPQRLEAAHLEKRLAESDVEAYLQQVLANPFKELVRGALIAKVGIT